MIARLRQAWRKRREARERAELDALKVRYHTFRILLANNERALERLARIETALQAGMSAGELAELVDETLAVTFEMVDGVSRLAAGGAGTLYARQLRLEEGLRAALEAVEEGGRGPTCLSLDQPLDAGEVGGKAAGLSQLRRNGFPVPDGFAVTARACREFLRETGLDERIRQTLRAACASDAALAEACDGIRRAILATPLPGWLREDLAAAAARLSAGTSADDPPALAARSSALTEDRPEHSFAGQFVTELNLSPKTLDQGFLAVMAGAFTERAVVSRREAGLPAATLDMAVLVQVMVPAVAAGVVFTVDPVHPETERMLVSAVPGLGILAVNGSVPVDIYRVSRDDPGDFVSQLARKTRRAVADAAGGIRRETVPPGERERPVLAPQILARLARLSLAAEALAGPCRDLEFALDGQDRLWLLQSRPARVMWGRHRPPAGPRERYRGGMTAVPGRCLGRAVHVDGEAALERPVVGPVIAVLSTAAPEAARRLPDWQGAVVAGGNPTDHLSTVARESGRPMLTRAMGAVEAIAEGDLIVLDAGEARVVATSPAIGDIGDLLAAPNRGVAGLTQAALSPGRARVRDLVMPLTLSDAFGPAFSVLECQTLHDIIRFAHETAVMSLFEAGDSLLAAAGSQVRLLRGDFSFETMVIDLGGGLREEVAGREMTAEAVASIPLAALCRGLATSVPCPASPAEADPAGEHGRSRRPVDEPNYVLAARDYLNLNARMEFHFAMIDAVCGPRPSGNYVRMRFKGGGAATPKRRRRALCLERILTGSGFFVSGQGDLITAALIDVPPRVAGETLELLGRLLGYSRFLDVAMQDDDAPYRVAEAFLAGDCAFPDTTPAAKA